MIQHWISRFGVPLQLHSDQERNFTSAIIKQLQVGCFVASLRRRCVFLFRRQFQAQYSNARNTSTKIVSCCHT
ncbi:hypothetical protein X975_11434, partial [Stegodyphus mimosarum]